MAPTADQQAPERPARTASTPVLELQYHPGDIRKGVRYVFLGRRQLLRIAAVAAAYLAFLAFAASVAWPVLRNARAAHAHSQLVRQRAELGDRLRTLVERLRAVQEKSDVARLEMEKIYMAYGFSHATSIGQGGYPFAADDVEAERFAASSIYGALIRQGTELRARTSEQLGVLDAFLGEVQSFEQAHQDQVRTTPSVSPLRGEDFVLTSPFGNRRSPFTKAIDFHAGIDLAAAVGTPIHAPADGVVTFAGRYPAKRSIAWWRYGNLVALLHGDRFITLFAHCDEIRVKNGQRVTQGEVIGTVGNSGWSTSPHLHYEVRRFDDDDEHQPVDPRIYILDHRWRDEERVLIRARNAPAIGDYEPLPRLIRR